uniref:EF-hand domain-containing protein n=1 Tax=Chaetoceros debilis TaxID=122233 RepID=A0A7S3VAB9_9STRA
MQIASSEEIIETEEEEKEEESIVQHYIYTMKSHNVTRQQLRKRRRRRQRQPSSYSSTSTQMLSRTNFMLSSTSSYNSDINIDSTSTSTSTSSRTMSRSRFQTAMTVSILFMLAMNSPTTLGHVETANTGSAPANTVASSTVSSSTVSSSSSHATQPNPTEPRGHTGQTLSAEESTTEASTISEPLSPPAAKSDAFLEIEGHTIGDEHRSSASSTSFFNFVDRDGDGKIRRPELIDFVMENIGGSDFDDEVNEVKPEVDRMMKNLDLNNDDGLDTGDVTSYWEKLESLLTVDEVADWVVHAVQLPSYIGDIVRDKHVTGYDFPELVEDNGKALVDELHITEKSFRTKIIRLMQARMLGIGSVPRKPSGIVATVESCEAIKLTWDRTLADGFPVHKYRVMRRTVGGGGYNAVVGVSRGGNHSRSGQDSEIEVCDISSAYNKHEQSEGGFYNSDGNLFKSGQDGESKMKTATTAAAAATTEHQKVSKKSSSCPVGGLVPYTVGPWRTVCETKKSDETECIDISQGLERGERYIYRIQAWNAVGNSPWSVLNANKEWSAFGCDVKYNSENPSRPELALPIVHAFPKIYRFLRTMMDGAWWFINIIVRVVLAALTVSQALMRVQRASATSTAVEMEPFFPWFLKEINRMSHTVIGVNIIAESFIVCRIGDSDHHDKVVNSIGLNGYHSQRTRSGRNLVQTKQTQPSPGNFLRSAQRSIQPLQKDAKNNLHINDAISDRIKAPEEKHEKSKSKRNEKNVPFIMKSQQLFTKKKEATTGYPPSNTDEVKSSSVEKSFPVSDTSDRDIILCVEVEQQSDRTKKGQKLWRRKRKINEQKCQPAETHFSNVNFQTKSLSSSYDIRDGPSCPSDDVDDQSRCNTCGKRYKMFKRCRHHCSRCWSSFCHKHGQTSHSNLLPCKVPGNCICNICLAKERR